MEQYALPVDLVDGPKTIDVKRLPVSTIQVVRGGGASSFKVEGSILGVDYIQIPVINLKGPERWSDSEYVPASVNGLFAVLSLGFTRLKISGGANGKYDVASLDADPGFIYERLTGESFGPALLTLQQQNEDLFAWLNEKWKLLNQILDPSMV